MAATSFAARTAAQSPVADDVPSWEEIVEAVNRSSELELVDPADLFRYTLTEGGDA